MFVVEDVHWIDPSTLDFLQLVMGQVASASILVVVTSRPEFVAPWGQRSEITPVVLKRLTLVQTADLILQVAGGKRLPAEVTAQVVDKTDGVPLFVEELTRMVLESGELVERHGHYELRGVSTQLTIPVTLHGSLMARLDRLGMAKDIAQRGSVMGREFSYNVLKAIVPYDEEILQAGLTQLVEAQLVFQRGLLPRSHYRFKHALIQDTAYNSLLRRRRQALHQQIAKVLTAQFPGIVESQPEMLAHHYTEAGLTEQAIPYWQQAGQQAIQRSAHPEAIAHLSQGLTLLITLPETPDRRQHELTFQATLGSEWRIAKGDGAPEAEGAYARARELCEQIGETPQIFSVLRGLLMYYTARGDIQTAFQLGEQLLRLALAQPDPAPLMLAHQQMGILLCVRGEFASAQTHHTRVLAIYDSLPRHGDLVMRFGTDLGSVCHSYLAWELWQLGYPDQALQHSREANTLAQKVSHPYSIAFALVFAAFLHQSLRDMPTTHELAEAAINLATDQGFEYWGSHGTILHGFALAMQGQGESGIAELRRGLAAYLATGSRTWQPYSLGLLAQAYGENGQTQEGLDVLDEALVETEATGIRFYAAELSRLKGILLLKQAVSDTPLAETCFHQAMTIAQNQSAKSWELRAATSLARLWQEQGKRQAAYALLLPVYQWFTEGFDTADLQDAKALLDELTEGSS